MNLTERVAGCERAISDIDERIAALKKRRAVEGRVRGRAAGFLAVLEAGDLAKKTKEQLARICRRVGLSAGGTKGNLIERLENALRE